MDIPTVSQPALQGHENFQAVLGAVATDAKAKLPDVAGRIDLAVQLVIDGAVTLETDTTAIVHSQSDPGLWYHVNGACDCPDAQYQAPNGWCKHRLSAAIQRRVQQRLAALEAENMAFTIRECPVILDDDAVPCHAVNSPCPHTEASAPSIPRQFVVELHGKQFVTYAGLLAMSHAQGLRELSARFIRVTAELAIAEATAVFADGRRFSEASDSTPQNCGAMVKNHFPRMALTRAKARVLRDALNIGICSLEEIGTD